MRLPDGTILMHGTTPYDPVKAHEYYMRTRELKGRRKGQQVMPSGATGRNRAGMPTYFKRTTTFTVKLPDGTTTVLTAQQLNEQKAYAQKRVNEIKQNLAKLSSELKKKMADAKAQEAKAKANADKPPTAAEKRKAAKESKQYRQEHQQELANKRKAAGTKTSTKSEPKSNSVADLESQISEIKGRLTVALAQARSLTSATKNG